MRIHQLTESSNQYLYEGLDRSATQTMILWENAGFKLKEAALTADQIQQIFQNVEQGATAAGGNRTMLGKGKDATVAIKKAYDDLVTKVQTSGPVKGADAMYDGAVAKIEAGLGGPDNAVNKVIQKYRKFAKEHPVAQGLIYSILIAAAGISGVGLGGAAVLGLLKMTDKLLQGEKFSTAVGKGLATGATAYAAGQIGQALKGTPADVPAAGDAAVAVTKGSLDAVRKQASSVAMKAVEDALASGTDPRLQGELANIAQNAIQQFTTLQGGPLSVQTSYALGQKIAMQAAVKVGGLESVSHPGKKLSEGQIYMIFNRVAAKEQLTEGPMDFIKGAAAKGMDKLKTVGKNLTTKVTADKLNSAWTKAGSPMDSEEVAKVIAAAGVSDDVVKSVYADLKIPAAGSAAGAKEDPQAQSVYLQVKDQISKLDKKGRQRLTVYLQKQLGTA